jgi:hypothetical protein
MMIPGGDDEVWTGHGESLSHEPARVQASGQLAVDAGPPGRKSASAVSDRSSCSRRSGQMLGSGVPSHQTSRRSGPPSRRAPARPPKKRQTQGWAQLARYCPMSTPALRDAERAVAYALQRWALSHQSPARLGGTFGAWRCGHLVVRVRPARQPSPIDVARILVERGVPVACPAELDPVTFGPWRVEAWHHISGTVGVRTDGEAGALAQTLHAVHAQMDLCDIPPVRHPSQLDGDDLDLYLHVNEFFSALDSHLATDTLTHGDAHSNNVVVTANTAVLVDLDTIGRGRPWWDLTELAVQSDRHRLAPAAQSAFLKAAGLPELPPEILESCAELRRRFMAAGL